MTLSTLWQPGWLAAVLIWNFLVLSAAQLTIRLIMAFSVRLTLVAAVVLSVLALPIAAIFDLLAGPQATVATRLSWSPVPMVLMAFAGYSIARWVLRIRRLRGQIIAALMVGLLDVHLFTILSR